MKTLNEKPVSTSAVALAAIAMLCHTAVQAQEAAAPGVQVQEGTRITVTPTVTDDVQVRSVELLVSGQVVGNDVSFPFELSTALPTLAQNGSSVVTLQVRATDTGGNRTISAPLVPPAAPLSALLGMVSMDIVDLDRDVAAGRRAAFNHAPDVFAVHRQT